MSVSLWDRRLFLSKAGLGSRSGSLSAALAAALPAGRPVQRMSVGGGTWREATATVSFCGAFAGNLLKMRVVFTWYKAQDLN